MTITELVSEFLAVRAPGWLVLAQPEVEECAVAAARFYAAYGDIRSLSKSDVLQEAAGADQPRPAPPEVEPELLPALPIKSLALITAATDVSTGEWAVIRPLFFLYTERENAQRLEASRGLGVDVFGRSVSEIAQDISREEEALPAKAFVHIAVEV